jgi:hypothetical protein
VLINDQGDGDLRGLLEFDLGAIPPLAKVTQATVTAFHWQGTQTTAVGIYANQQAWQQTTVTYNNKPAIGPLLDSHVPGPLRTFETWDVTSSVRDMTDGTAPNHGWQLVDANDNPNVVYLSSDARGPFGPALCVTYLCNAMRC